VRYYRWQKDRVEHHVEVTTVGEWLKDQLGIDPLIYAVGVVGLIAIS